MPSARTVDHDGSCLQRRTALFNRTQRSSRGEVARYARSRTITTCSAIDWTRSSRGCARSIPSPSTARAYVDTGPVQERVYAQYAGLGWIGKNTCLINPELGSWLLLGAVICSLPLETDAPALDQCGTCTLCLEACPTGAFVEARVLDATRCISYLTIEYRGPIPEEHRASLGNHLFGCDICQEVCPWNRAPVPTRHTSWSSRDDLNGSSIIDLWRRSDAELAEWIGDTPMTRAGVRGLRRNLAVALGNSGDRRALEALNEERSDEHDRRPPCRRAHALGQGKALVIIGVQLYRRWRGAWHESTLLGRARTSGPPIAACCMSSWLQTARIKPMREWEP